MKNEQFTPGPWQIDKRIRLKELTRLEIFAIGDRVGSGRWIADINILESINPEANANLIAAAPDMYEALKRALPYVKGAYECAFPDQWENDSVIEAIDAALSKANPQSV